jgi:hypothetical protein
MISRRKILKSGAAAAVIVSLPFLSTRRSFAQSAISFDYFISPVGDDNNAGTLASPWSITALNSKQSTYRGKNVGIIGDVGGVQTPITHGTVGGVQTTLASLVNASGTQPALNIDGGAAGSPTYIASCNSSGVYTARSAIIDAGTPSGDGILMGQSSESATQVPHPGNITFDGLTIRNFSFCAIQIANPGGSILNGCTVKNCEIYNGSCSTSANNPGAIRYWNVYGMLITNNKFHDLGTRGGGGSPVWGLSAIMAYGNSPTTVYAAVITNNTTYNCNSLLQKDQCSDFANCSYNYFDHGKFGSCANTDGGIGQGSMVAQQPAPGTTSVFHHNICLGGLWLYPQSGTNWGIGSYQIYNNTFYGTPNYPSFEVMGVATGFGANPAAPPSGAAAVQFYNNLIYATNGYNSQSLYVATSAFHIANATFNTNVYGNGMSFATVDYATEPLASWKSTTGCDQNSVLISSTPFTSTPTAITPSSFAVNSLAVIGGVTCGAIDGTGLVGCDFAGAPTPTPAAPSLTVT